MDREKMSWNYRVMKRSFQNEDQYAIYEVYYDKHDKIKMWSSEPIYICGESLEELVKDFQLYAKAFEQPILDYNELEKQLNI